MYDQDEGANQAFSGGLDVDKSRIYPVYNRTFSTEWGDNDNDGDAGEVVIETSGKCDWIEHGTAGNKWTADSGICAGKIDFADYTGSGSFDNTEGLINDFQFFTFTSTFSIYTLLFFGGLLPLCGIGVVSLIDIILNPLACNALKAVSLPEPGPLTSTDRIFIPASSAFTAAASAAI